MIFNHQLNLLLKVEKQSLKGSRLNKSGEGDSDRLLPPCPTDWLIGSSCAVYLQGLIQNGLVCVWVSVGASARP